MGSTNAVSVVFREGQPWTIYPKSVLEGDARLLTVNPYWLEVPLNPLAGLADGGEEDLEPFEGVSVDDERSCRDVIRKRIVPYINSMNSESIIMLRTAFSIT